MSVQSNPMPPDMHDPALLRETVDILRALVGFDTTSSRSNRELIDWVASYLRDLGIDSTIQPDESGTKANLLATIGPSERAPVMLSGHSDVVPVEGQNWSSDPFTLTERDGRLHGRGSADMKAYIACVLAAVPALKRASLRTPVQIALSFDEETTMHGMKTMARGLRDSSIKPVAAIIGEPTSMRVVVAHKGAAIWRVTVRGKPVHSSLKHLGVSAVEIAGEIISYVNALQRSLQDGRRNDAFEFPFTSLHVGQIHGGTAHNITASECHFVLEVRAMPGASAGDLMQRVRDYALGTLLPDMRAVSPDCAISFDEVLDSPALDDVGNRHLARAMMTLCNCGELSRVSFATEGGFLQGIGVPTIICGPGDIAVAHQADEYVEPAQLAQCNAFLASLRERLVEGAWPPDATQPGS